jgi:Ca2+-binding EF-hand superfamily protein
MQDDEPNEGFVTFKDFDREMKRILVEKNPAHTPATADILLQAFRCIDTQSLGYIESDVMERLLLTKGEAFRAQELDDFFLIARDPDSGHVFYEDYVSSTTKGR